MYKDTIFNKKKSLRFRNNIYFIEEPIIMGIINIDAESFYKGSIIKNVDNFVNTVSQMLNDGATIIDIGAASSRPGAELVSSDEELKRLQPYLNEIPKSFPNTWFSIDTYNSITAQTCVEKYGFYMINDISAYSIDSNMFTTIIRLNVPYVLMHMKGIPKTMQTQTQYNDVVAEVFQFLGIKKHELTSEGLNDIIIDPGFGFGKTIEQNFKILKNLELFEALECPILVGLSRKSLIYKTLQISPDEAITGSTVLHTIALLKRADIIRTHDVKETKQVIKLLTAYFYA